MSARVHQERGFSLIEIIIVLVIVAILFAIAASTFGSTKDGANRTKVISVAQSYDQAITSFASDHSGRIPVPGQNATDWPTLNRGPLEPSVAVAGGAAPPYLRSIPEFVSDGVVKLVTTRPAPGATVPAGSVGVAYLAVDTAAVPPTRYRIEVWPGKAGKFDTKPNCQMGTWQATGVATC